MRHSMKNYPKLCAEMTLFRASPELRDKGIGVMLANSEPHQVRLYADFEAIMRRLAERAYRQKRGEARYLHGAIRVTVKKIGGENENAQRKD